MHNFPTLMQNYSELTVERKVSGSLNKITPIGKIVKEKLYNIIYQKKSFTQRNPY
jgi:hypothetical protein